MEQTKVKRKKVRLSTSDKVFYFLMYLLLAIVVVIIVWPIIYVVSSSFSSGAAVTSGRVVLLPVDFSLTGYKIVLSYELVWIGYRNTLFYTVVGTFINLVMTTLAAYPLSRPNFQGRKIYMTLFVITMFFAGGLVPSYILMLKLHMVNTVWALLIPGAVSVYNMIIMRTFFKSNVSGELLDAAKIDGCSDIGYLLKIVIPLSKAIFAVVTLYYAVGHWNSYFNAMIYIRNRSLYPLQIVLRNILNAGKVDLSEITDPEVLVELTQAADVMKYALIVISSVPIIVAYTFVQRFFEKGVMIGSVKG